MISTLVKSAFKTGCLSVESEGLIRQVVARKGYQSADLDALASLCEAVDAGYIRRETACKQGLPMSARPQICA